MTAQKSRISNTQMSFNFPFAELPEQGKTVTGFPKRVLDCIPLGRQNAIKSKAIARRLNVKDIRQVTLAVQILRTKYRLPVGASMIEPFGYYMISNFQEYQESLNTFTHSALESLKTVEALKQSKWGQLLTVKINSKKGKKDETRN